MAYVSIMLDKSLNLRPPEISFSVGRKCSMVLNAKILFFVSLALEMLKKKVSLVLEILKNQPMSHWSWKCWTWGQWGEGHPWTALPLPTRRTASLYNSLVIVSKDNYSVIFFIQDSRLPWKNCKFVNPKFTLNIWDFLEGKTGRDTSGVGLLFRWWHVTDRHIGHRCLMWAAQ